MRTIITLLSLLIITSSNAQDCPMPIGDAILDINNVRAVITNGTQNFEDNGNAGYNVPQDGPATIYSDAIWISGISPDGTIKLAAQTYRANGGDFYAGPLPTSLTTPLDPDLCVEYDQVFEANRSAVALHHEYHTRLLAVETAGADPAILTQSPFEAGYTAPEYFYTWPAINETEGYARDLAPYYDFNADGDYDPDMGDYPGFDLFNSGDCAVSGNLIGAPLLGHQATWYVSHDQGTHLESSGTPLGIEVQVTNFAYQSDDALNDATFARYLITNRSTNSYSDTRIGKWMDTDIGCAADDHVGCDVSRGLAYGYNADLNDENCVQLGYGTALAAQGVSILRGPLKDSDGIDNPLTGDVQLAIIQDGISYPGLGRGFGDDVIDNEEVGMGHFVFYNIGQNPINGDPSTPVDFHNYMKGYWKNGAPITYGGQGMDTSQPTARYMLPGSSDPLGVGTDGEIIDDTWSEESVGNQAGDRRFMMSTGGFTLDPGETVEYTVAYLWAQDQSGTTNAVGHLQAAHDVVKGYYDDCFSTVPDIALGLEDNHVLQDLSVFPNPASDILMIEMGRDDIAVSTLRIIDLQGRVADLETLLQGSAIRIEVDELTPGYYILEVMTTQGEIATRSFVKK